MLLYKRVLQRWKPFSSHLRTLGAASSSSRYEIFMSGYRHVLFIWLCAGCASTILQPYTCQNTIAAVLTAVEPYTTNRFAVSLEHHLDDLITQVAFILQLQKPGPDLEIEQRDQGFSTISAEAEKAVKAGLLCHSSRRGT